jgi:hypothetical protein
MARRGRKHRPNCRSVAGVAEKGRLARGGVDRSPSGQTKTFAVHVDNVIKIEPSSPKTGLRGEPTSVLTYINGQSDTVRGTLEITIRRLNGEITDVTSLG